MSRRRTMFKKYNKITSGFVIQAFEKRDKKFVCVEQEFMAGDPVDREDEQGEPVDVDVREEQYEPLDMVQPGWDYCFLYVHAGVDAKKIGPFPTEQERDNALENHRQKGREDYDSYFPFDISKGAKVQF
jgi:hypothetical protein